MAKKKLTPRQEKYAQNVAKGMSKKDAAQKAGYSEKNAAEGAMRNGAWSAAVTAEVARGKAAGLYINRSELVVNKVETMDKEQILDRLKELYYETGGILPMGTIIEGDSETS